MLSLIAAVARNGVIGKDNQLLWHLPGDMRHFRETTRGKPVIMGRKTWDSLPEKFRPLPGRTNVVITRQQAWSAPGAIVAHSLGDAIVQCGAVDTIWVMGGANVYAQALPMADQVVVTEIDADFEGDAYAPILGEQFQPVEREAHVSSQGLPFAFVTYVRVG